MSLRDTYVLDGVFVQSLNVLRFGEGEKLKMLQILRNLERELVGNLLSEKLTEFTRDRTERLLAQARQVIRKFYGDIQYSSSALEVGAVIASDTARLLSMVIPGYTANLPIENVMAALLGDALIQGSPASAWWARQAEDTAFRFAAAVRQGMVAAEATRDIVARITGRPGSPGVMDVSRKNASSLVLTSTQTVANAARLQTFKANADVIDGLVWVTALDGHVCTACAARADLQWSISDHSPIGGHVVPFANPPIHFNDRCVLIAKTKSFKELGIDMPEFQMPRASGQGVQPGGTTFADFLRRQGPQFQDEVLGKGRAQLWRNGKISLQDLISGSGRPMSLEQLQAAHP